MGKKVLIVDDAIFMRKTLADIVENDLNYQVVGEGVDGDSAVNLYFELKPDIVLLDIVMPNKNGLDAAKEILAKDKNAKIVIVSALGQQNMVIDALKTGVKDFIIKPFKKEKIIKVLSKI